MVKRGGLDVPIASLIGRQCRKIMANYCSILEPFKNLNLNYQLLVSIWSTTEKVFCILYTGKFQHQLQEVLLLWHFNLITGFGPKIFTPTMHEVICHSKEFFDKHGALGAFDESVCESTHFSHHKHYHYSNKRGDLEKTILANTFLYQQLMENLDTLKSITRSNKERNVLLKKNELQNFLYNVPKELRGANPVSNWEPIPTVHQTIEANIEAALLDFSIARNFNDVELMKNEIVESIPLEGSQLQEAQDKEDHDAPEETMFSDVEIEEQQSKTRGEFEEMLLTEDDDIDVPLASNQGVLWPLGANKYSPYFKQDRCNCQSECSNGRCKCKKNSRDCTADCHKNNKQCKNKH